MLNAEWITFVGEKRREKRASRKKGLLAKNVHVEEKKRKKQNVHMKNEMIQ